MIRHRQRIATCRLISCVCRRLSFDEERATPIIKRPKAAKPQPDLAMKRDGEMEWMTNISSHEM
jgi:hypothetical protein